MEVGGMESTLFHSNLYMMVTSEELRKLMLTGTIPLRENYFFLNLHCEPKHALHMFRYLMTDSQRSVFATDVHDSSAHFMLTLRLEMDSVIRALTSKTMTVFNRLYCDYNFVLNSYPGPDQDRDAASHCRQDPDHKGRLRRLLQLTGTGASHPLTML